MLGIHDPWYSHSGTENRSRSTQLSAAMGFRSLLKGLRASDKKNTSTTPPSPSAAATDKNETISIVTNSSTLQPVVSVSGVGVTTAATDKTEAISVTPSSATLEPVAAISSVSVTSKQDDKPRDLWDEAWTMLSKDDPKLKQKYEAIILTEGEGDNKSHGNNLGKSRNILSPNQMADMTGVKRLLDHLNVKSSYDK